MECRTNCNTMTSSKVLLTWKSSWQFAARSFNNEAYVKESPKQCEVLQKVQKQERRQNSKEGQGKKEICKRIYEVLWNGEIWGTEAKRSWEKKMC